MVYMSVICMCTAKRVRSPLLTGRRDGLTDVDGRGSSRNRKQCAPDIPVSHRRVSRKKAIALLRPVVILAGQVQMSEKFEEFVRAHALVLYLFTPPAHKFYGEGCTSATFAACECNLNIKTTFRVVSEIA